MKKLFSKTGTGWVERRNELVSTSPVVVALLVSAAMTACGPGSPGGGPDSSEPVGGLHPDPEYSREALLGHIGAIAFETYRDLSAASGHLVATTGVYATSLAADDRTAAQDAWRDAIALGQRGELFRFGPAAQVGVAAGGEGLADEIYSWSVSTNTCRVDEETLAGAFTDPVSLAGQSINVRGLDALEYLLFAETTDNSCLSNVSINTEGTWDARRGEVEQLRADHAHALAKDLQGNVEALLAAWDPAQGNFLAQLTGAGQTSDAYPTVHDAFNDIGGALFYLDLQTKDRKVGIPAGVFGCDTETCPEELESLFAHASREHIQHNLEGFELLYRSDEANGTYGLEDQLRDVGADALADEVGSELEAATAQLQGMEDQTLADALVSELESVRSAYAAIKVMTDTIKNELIHELGLEVSAAGPGDAD